MTAEGIFIALEGIDGSGKKTQYQKLLERLEVEGYSVVGFDFPQYDQPSSFFVREYLKGAYGTVDQVNPYTSSLFYALDRYAAATRIREALQSGKVVVANRFTGSSMAHQGTKLKTTEERRGFFLWLETLEFQMLEIPRPQQSFVLRLPAKTAEGLRDKRTEAHQNKPLDIHEADDTHMQRAVTAYDDVCQLLPKDFTAVDVMRDGQLLDVNAVHEELWTRIVPLLPPKGIQTPKSLPRYYIPANFSNNIRQQYTETMEQILQLRADMLSKAAQTLSTEAPDLIEALKATLPVATLESEKKREKILHAVSNDLAKKLADNYLPENHAGNSEAVRLVSFWPRNELDLVATMLYEHSSQPLANIEREVQSWPIARKEEAMRGYLGYLSKHSKGDTPDCVLRNTHYSWDLLTDYATYHKLRNYVQLEDMQHQPLTPRYGYEVPAAIEEAGLTDQYEACFDLSLQLHSKLQGAGYTHEAQYATLLGHRTRWKMTYNAAQAAELATYTDCKELILQLQEKLSEVHPLIGEAFRSIK